MRTQRRPCHKAFNIARTKKSFPKSVTMKYFMAQTKLHVEAQNTKRSGCFVVSKKIQFCAFEKCAFEAF